uniref:Carbohydrate-binding domain-containing protein n=1 Tax=Schlesneria paludicola TaxID=360056 RepID=A0A7C4QNL3_9PLAN
MSPISLCRVGLMAAWTVVVPCFAEPPRSIVIDGRFDDWAGVKSYTDPAGDTHDVEHKERFDQPEGVDHPDVDLLEYRVAHDDENLYVYFRARGVIGRTQTARHAEPAGRYYVIVTIDADDNDDTGYWLHEGGYYPTSRGYDLNAEIEYFDGELNTACYLNHGARNEAELHQAFLDQSAGQYRAGHDGPYPAGFLRLLPGTYKQYTQWVYHEDGRITFVRDKGPVVRGIATAALSADGHRLEAKFPFRGFLKDERNLPIMATGRKIDLSFSLEASGELAPGKRWASDTGEPITGYLLEPSKAR